VRIVEGELYLGGTFDAKYEWSAIRALDSASGNLRWEFKPPGAVPDLAGILSTAGNIVVAGIDNMFYALDSENGQLLWQLNLGGKVAAAPITYQVKNQQYITISAGRTVFAFGTSVSEVAKGSYAEGNIRSGSR
jgi:outer membrane protein assembly factor BamB